MRPIIKKKRIDPRYFLHETVEEGIKLSVKQKAVMDKDDDGDIDGDDLAALRSQEEHEKSDDEDGDGVRDPKDRPGLTLLKGEKTLYEKIRNAIEEMLDEYLEEQQIRHRTLHALPPPGEFQGGPRVPGGGYYKPERPADAGLAPEMPPPLESGNLARTELTDPLENELVNLLNDPIYGSEAQSALQALRPDIFHPPGISPPRVITREEKEKK